MSEIIRARLDAAGVPYLANDNVADYLLEGELDL
ncbi:MAG: GTP cyclohydrolase I, partial [Synechococcaceae bacterium WB5_2A_257]|nr:GTP cyclohydrolase I [Synechococcaceae bacterium WB5_2A_257]